MNIEQIKKDWEQHCEEYGFKSYICQNPSMKKYITVNLKVEINSGGKYLSWSEITLDSGSSYDDVDVRLCKSEKQYYKLFATFYEKLLEGK